MSITQQLNCRPHDLVHISPNIEEIYIGSVDNNGCEKVLQTLLWFIEQRKQIHLKNIQFLHYDCERNHDDLHMKFNNKLWCHGWKVEYIDSLMTIYKSEIHIEVERSIGEDLCVQTKNKSKLTNSAFDITPIQTISGEKISDDDMFAVRSIIDHEKIQIDVKQQKMPYLQDRLIDIITTYRMLQQHNIEIHIPIQKRELACKYLYGPFVCTSVIEVAEFMAGDDGRIMTITPAFINKNNIALFNVSEISDYPYYKEYLIDVFRLNIDEDIAAELYISETEDELKLPIENQINQYKYEEISFDGISHSREYNLKLYYNDSISKNDNSNGKPPIVNDMNTLIDKNRKASSELHTKGEFEIITIYDWSGQPIRTHNGEKHGYISEYDQTENETVNNYTWDRNVSISLNEILVITLYTDFDKLHHELKKCFRIITKYSHKYNDNILFKMRSCLASHLNCSQRFYHGVNSIETTLSNSHIQLPLCYAFHANQLNGYSEESESSVGYMYFRVRKTFLKPPIVILNIKIWLLSCSNWTQLTIIYRQNILLGVSGPLSATISCRYNGCHNILCPVGFMYVRVKKICK